MSEALRLSTAYQVSLSHIGSDQPRWATTTDRLLEGIQSLSTMSGTVLDEWATAETPPSGSIARQAPIAELYSASSASAALVGLSIEPPPAMLRARQNTLTLQIEPALARVDARLIDAYRGAAGVIDRYP